MTLIDDLRAIGLTKSEATVYLYVLENGVSTPPQIAKGTSILRTNCYHIVQSLERQSLLRPQTGKGRRVAYLASDPEALFHSIETKREAINQILPDLRGLYTTQKNKPKIQFYDGLEQIKQVYWQSLEANEVYGIGSTKKLSEVLPDVSQRYVEELKKRSIVFHDILTSASKETPWMEESLKGLYGVKYLPTKYQDLPTDMLFWDDHIALITLDQPYFATIVTNPLLTKTMRTLFQVMWENLASENKKLS